MAAKKTATGSFKIDCSCNPLADSNEYETLNDAEEGAESNCCTSNKVKIWQVVSEGEFKVVWK
jgi:hypothetical protein